jgi:hypothetical protein
VSSGIGEHPEAHARYLLRGLGYLAPELLGPLQRCRDVLDRDEEEDLVLGALTRADRDRRAAIGAGVDEGVAGEGSRISATGSGGLSAPSLGPATTPSRRVSRFL